MNFCTHVKPGCMKPEWKWKLSAKPWPRISWLSCYLLLMQGGDTEINHKLVAVPKLIPTWRQSKLIIGNNRGLCWICSMLSVFTADCMNRAAHTCQKRSSSHWRPLRTKAVLRLDPDDCTSRWKVSVPTLNVSSISIGSIHATDQDPTRSRTRQYYRLN